MIYFNAGENNEARNYFYKNCAIDHLWVLLIAKSLIKSWFSVCITIIANVALWSRLLFTIEVVISYVSIDDENKLFYLTNLAWIHFQFSTINSNNLQVDFEQYILCFVTARLSACTMSRNNTTFAKTQLPS